LWQVEVQILIKSVASCSLTKDIGVEDRLRNSLPVVKEESYFSAKKGVQVGEPAEDRAWHRRGRRPDAQGRWPRERFEPVSLRVFPGESEVVQK
jgi:hypothetical protein